MNKPKEKGDTFSLFVLAGNDTHELKTRILEVLYRVRNNPGVSREELVSELASREPGIYRAAVVADDIAGLRDKLEYLLTLVINPLANSFFPNRGIYVSKTGNSPPPGKTVLVLPGFGSEYAGMLRGLDTYFPQVNQWLDCLRDITDGTGQVILRDYPTCRAEPEQAKEYYGVKGTGLAGFISTMALYEVLKALGVGCDMMVGHSNGENAALIAAGMLNYQSITQFQQIIRKVSRYDQVVSKRKPDSGGFYIAASAVDVNALDKLIAASSGDIHVAIDNCPQQVILFVKEKNSRESLKKISAVSGVCVKLLSNQPYHTPLFKPHLRKLRHIYNDVRISEGHIPVYSCVSTEPFPDDPRVIRELATKQWSTTVRFRETVKQIYNDGGRIFIEVGPNSLLSGFIRDVLRGKEHLTLYCNSKRKPGVEQLFHFVAELYVRGMPVNIEALCGTNSTNSGTRENSRSGTGKPALSTVGTLNQEMPGGYDEVLQGHFDLMQDFLAIQSRVLTSVDSALRSRSPVNYRKELQIDSNRWPLLGELVEKTPGRLHCERTFNVEKDMLITDHSIGSLPHQLRPDVFPLPVLPFTVSMEIAAEAGAFLLDDSYSVVCIKDSRAYRWLALDCGQLRLAIFAEMVSIEGDGSVEVQVKLYEAGEKDSDEGRPAFEARVVLAPFTRSVNPIFPRELEHPEKLRVSLADFYNEYVFHGPCYHSIKKVHEWSKEGVIADLTVTGIPTPDAGVVNPYFRIPASLLDGAGQLVGYWLIEQSFDDFGVFPFQVASYTRHKTVPPVGSTVECRAFIKTNSPSIIESKFEFIDSQGEVICRMAGFQQRHYTSKWIPQFFKKQSRNLYYSSPAADTDPGHICRSNGTLSPDFLKESQAIWSRVLAHLVLNADERRQWYRMPNYDDQRYLWLMGRLAAKDAVREWAQLHHGIPLLPVEIELVDTEQGNVSVRCPPLEPLEDFPGVSIRISDGRSVAEICKYNI
jgi:malonyl CoA-acyl carrier protein transacylase